MTSASFQSLLRVLDQFGSQFVQRSFEADLVGNRIIQLQNFRRRATELLAYMLARRFNARRVINELPGAENRHEQIGISSVSRHLRFEFCLNAQDFTGLRNSKISFIDCIRHESTVRLVESADLQGSWT